VRLFRPFERGTTRRNVAGAGLGLWITRRIVDTQDYRYDGTAVIDATTITFYSATARQITGACGETATTPRPNETLHYTYTADIAGGTLQLIDSDCASKYASDPASINAFCRVWYHKQ